MTIFYNHKAAKNFSNTQPDSNLANCYLELVKVLEKIAEFDCTGMTTGPCGECPSCIARNALEG